MSGQSQSLRHGHTTSSDSRHSSALLFASSSFNLPGYPAIRLGSLTPLVPSITGSHHVSSTWPPNLFPSGPSTLQLTIDQANNIFGLASECQALPVPPAPSYWQVREPAATKQSPHRAAALDIPAESSKAKCSCSKSGTQQGSGCSSNTSTPKCPDSTSAKKPSCPKESTMEDQAKSPQACSSQKCSRSPSPTSGSAGHKQKDLRRDDTSVVDNTLPISSSMFDAFHSLMGSVSDVIEPLPPSITSIPLCQASLRVSDTGIRPHQTAGTHQLRSLQAQASTYLATLPSGLGALLPWCPASLVPTMYRVPGLPTYSPLDHQLCS